MNAPAVTEAPDLQKNESQTGAARAPHLWPVKVLYFLLFAAQGVYYTLM
jgi:hypothetical protein